MSTIALAVRLAAATLVLAVVWPAAAGQKPSLGDVARQEEGRRKAVEASRKVLTNKDLPPSAQKPVPGSPAPAGQATQAPSEEKAGAKAAAPGEAREAEEAEEKEEREERNEAWWRTRLTQAHESLRRNEILLEALQSRVNALSTEFVSRDDPFQRAQIGEDRQKALAEMERVGAEIELAKKQIETIQEEARRAGIPPGWLR